MHGHGILIIALICLVYRHADTIMFQAGQLEIATLMIKELNISWRIPLVQYSYYIDRESF